MKALIAIVVLALSANCLQAPKHPVCGSIIEVNGTNCVYMCDFWSGE